MIGRRVLPKRDPEDPPEPDFADVIRLGYETLAKIRPPKPKSRPEQLLDRRKQVEEEMTRKFFRERRRQETLRDIARRRFLREELKMEKSFNRYFFLSFSKLVIKDNMADSTSGFKRRRGGPTTRSQAVREAALQRATKKPKAFKSVNVGRKRRRGGKGKELVTIGKRLQTPGSAGAGRVIPLKRGRRRREDAPGQGSSKGKGRQVRRVDGILVFPGSKKLPKASKYKNEVAAIPSQRGERAGQILFKRSQKVQKEGGKWYWAEISKDYAEFLADFSKQRDLRQDLSVTSGRRDLEMGVKQDRKKVHKRKIPIGPDTTSRQYRTLVDAVENPTYTFKRKNGGVGLGYKLGRFDVVGERDF